MSTTTSSTATPATPPAESGVRRVLNFIRWILLVPLTLAVPTLIFSWFKNMSAACPNSFWYFMSKSVPLMVLLTAQWFMPALLTVPTASAIAPSHRKKVSSITLITAACFWLFAFSVLPQMDTGLFYSESFAFLIPILCALLIGLAAGFAAVRLILTKNQ